MIFGAEYIIYLTIILMFALAFKSGLKEKKALILAVFSIPLVVILIKFIHLFIVTPRPFEAYEAGASFPSRHASLMAAFAFAYVIFRSKWALLFLSLTAWVGVARVYTGVHFPVDILGGIGVGLLSCLFARGIIRLLKARLF